jgi:hypothetical protein
LDSASIAFLALLDDQLHDCPRAAFRVAPLINASTAWAWGGPLSRHGR